MRAVRSGKTQRIGHTPEYAAGDATSVLTDLASNSGSSLVNYKGSTVEVALDARLPELSNYAALDAYTGPLLSGVYVRGCANVFDGGHGIFRPTSDTPAAANGIYRRDALNRWWKRDVSGKIFTAWFGPGRTAIQQAINYANSLSQTTTYPYVIPKIIVTRGQHLIDAPIESAYPIDLDGVGVEIKASPDFAGVTRPLAAGGTYTNSAMISLVSGNAEDAAGAIRWKASIGKGITLTCDDRATVGVYIERMPYSSINCEVQGASQDAVVVGPMCWGLNLDNIVIENFTRYAVYFKKDSAVNGGSMVAPRIWGEFKTGTAGLYFEQDAQSNGFAVVGGLIEKTLYGVIRAPGNGPLGISSVDFEQCQYQTVRIVGAVGDGDVTVDSCFLHSIEAEKVFAQGATVHVSNCKFYGTSYDYGTGVGGAIVATNNVYSAGYPNPVAGASLHLSVKDESANVTRQYLPTKSPAFVTQYTLENYAYGDSPNTISSGLTFTQAYQGGSSAQYVGMSNWYTAEYLHATNPGSPRRIGVALGSVTAGKEFRPMDDSVLSLGSGSYRWTTVYANNNAISTSDMREKQQIRSLSDAEKRVAKKLKRLIVAFKWNSSVEEKGDDARIHFGVMAQEVAKTFEDEGLDPRKYALFCFDSWSETQEVVDENGNVIEKARPAGERYGIRYEQLLAFIISAL